LFCNCEISPNKDASAGVLGVFGKLLTRKGCMGLGSMMFGQNLRCKKFLNIE
jgi:hypothetical protein